MYHSKCYLWSLPCIRHILELPDEPTTTRQQPQQYNVNVGILTDASNYQSTAVRIVLQESRKYSLHQSAIFIGLSSNIKHRIRIVKMSSGFVTESELAEVRKQRQEEWERVRQPDQPIGNFHLYLFISQQLKEHTTIEMPMESNIVSNIRYHSVRNHRKCCVYDDICYFRQPQNQQSALKRFMIHARCSSDWRSRRTRRI